MTRGAYPSSLGASVGSRGVFRLALGRSRACFWVQWLIFLALAVAPRPVAAQARYAVPQEPRLLTLDLQQADVGLYSEGSYQQTTFPGSTVDYTESHLFLGPSVGMTLDGSVYHPNLFHFTFAGQGAAGFEHIKVGSGTTSSTHDQFQYLGNFGAGATILRDKPANGSLFGGYGRSFQDYDSFNRVWVEGWRYGARANYNSGPWSLSGGYLYSDTSNDTITGNYSTIQEITDFIAAHDREYGGTRFNYTYNQNNYTAAASQMSGSDQTISLGDREQFGSQKQYQFNNSVSYTTRDYVNENNQELIAESTFNGQHPHNLSSSVTASYDNFQQGSYNSDTFSGNAALTHQLYESLNSSLNLLGSDNETSDANRSGYFRVFGGGLNETYTKRLSSHAVLHVNESFLVNHNEQQSIGVVKNEQHTFPPNNSFALNQPNVRPLSIVVYQNNGQPPYRQGIDYSVSGDPSRTFINRLDGGNIPAGATVLVNYDTLATGPGSYDTATEGFQVRVELWDRFLSAFGRIDISRNDAPADLRIPAVTSYTLGAELNWRWLGLGAEYQIYESEGYHYNAARLFQSAGFSPDGFSTASLNFSESWIDYSQTGQQEQIYRFVGRYHRSLTHRLGLDADLGASYHTGLGVDQTLAIARAAINYAIGKTTITATYDYGYESFHNGEQRQRHLFFFNLKRVF
jgi:hypothetical protein